MVFYERNCILKWMIFFASFCWLWFFLLENLKSIDKLQLWSLDHLFSGPNVIFLGLFWGVIASVILIFLSPVNHGGRHFCWAPPSPPPSPSPPRPPPKNSFLRSSLQNLKVRHGYWVKRRHVNISTKNYAIFLSLLFYIHFTSLNFSCI